MNAASEWIEAIRAMPGVLWVAFAVLIVVLFRRAILDRLPTLTSLELPGGVKAQFEGALTTAGQQKGVPVTPEARSRLERRIVRDAELLRGSSALWVDDDPASTRSVREALTALGVTTETAMSTEDGISRLQASRFDVVLSDMARGDDPSAGSAFAKLAGDLDPSLPVIIYLGRIDRKRGIPPAVFGMADRPDDLLHLVIDALERRRG